MNNNPVKEPIPYLRIHARTGWAPVDLRELWQHRNLLFYLVWREIRGKYASTAFGVLWVVISPLATALVFSLVFGFFLKVGTGTLPYPVVVFSGMCFWLYFAVSVSNGCNSMVNNAYLLSKVYFPRLIIPLIPILVGLIDLTVLLCATFAMALFYGVTPSFSWLFLFVCVIIVMGLATGISLWLSSLNVIYRDVSAILPVALQIGMYLTPVVYLSSIAPKNLYYFFALNPMVGIIDSVRWALFQNTTFPLYSLCVSLGIILVLIISGAFYFRRIDETAADLV